MDYGISETDRIVSPALLFYKALIRKNIARAIEAVGNPDKLRPHVKTHKTREIVHMELEQGIRKHKCATVAEAEMLASAGVLEVFVAYSLVGPNCLRMAELVRHFPGCRFSVAADHTLAVRALSEAMTAAKREVDVVLDLDVGMHRTGVDPLDERAVSLYELIDELPGLRPGGLHVYDGHNSQQTLTERTAAVKELLGPVLALSSRLEKKGLPIPRLIAGGSPTFPVFAQLDLPGLECSPGTCFLNDHGYGTRYADLGDFTPAAVLFTRVISRPTTTRVTLDLGYKSVASDPPAGKRCVLLNVPSYETVLQSEEHLVIETPDAGRFRPGDEVYALPTHICPTCAMHRHAYVVENGRVTERWEIVARDRVLTV